MSELRHDDLHRTWVILAPGRGDRPRDVALRTVPSAGGPCPFCPGLEAQTPPEVLATGRPPGRPADAPPWRVRVFPNRYPAVDGVAGRHEVVVLSPHHRRDLPDLSADHVAEVLAAVQARMAALEARAELAAVTFFLNSGAGAGATLSHPHGQLLATPAVPAVLGAELAAMEAWRREHGACLLCGGPADAEVVAAEPLAVAVAPHASRFAWETLLMPRRHEARFTAATAAELHAVADLLVRVTAALRAAAGDPAYNLVLHSAPPASEDFHWHLEVMPRLAPLAGFEAGTGFYINPVDPARAAAALRAELPPLRARTRP